MASTRQAGSCGRPEHGRHWPLLACLLVALCLPPAGAAAAECVVTLHGLGRTRWSMALLADRLADAGYAVQNLGYASRSAPVEALAAVVDEGLEACRRDGHRPVHFVAHSLGGLLVRQRFSGRVPADVGRLVMLAPPNHGSEVVDRARGTAWFRLFTGHAGQVLGTDPSALPARLPPPAFDVGVIAGDASAIPFFRDWLPGPDDGIVSVASTRLEGMRDFLVLPHGHTFIMNSRDVARQVLAFLRRGRFDHAMIGR